MQQWKLVGLQAILRVQYFTVGAVNRLSPIHEPRNLAFLAHQTMGEWLVCSRMTIGLVTQLTGVTLEDSPRKSFIGQPRALRVEKPAVPASAQYLQQAMLCSPKVCLVLSSTAPITLQPLPVYTNLRSYTHRKIAQYGDHHCTLQPMDVESFAQRSLYCDAST